MTIPDFTAGHAPLVRELAGLRVLARQVLDARSSGTHFWHVGCFET